MHTLLRYTVKVTTPYKRPDNDAIVQDMQETIKLAIEQVIKDNLDNLDITGLSIEIK